MSEKQQESCEARALTSAWQLSPFTEPITGKLGARTAVYGHYVTGFTITLLASAYAVDFIHLR